MHSWSCTYVYNEIIITNGDGMHVENDDIDDGDDGGGGIQFWVNEVRSFIE